MDGYGVHKKEEIIKQYVKGEIKICRGRGME